jgi:hypothetical protein
MEDVGGANRLDDEGARTVHGLNIVEEYHERE